MNDLMMDAARRGVRHVESLTTRKLYPSSEAMECLQELDGHSRMIPQIRWKCWRFLIPSVRLLLSPAQVGVVSALSLALYATMIAVLAGTITLLGAAR
ncbi:MAG: hypothetical protein R6X31_10075 [Anaerolineae bacterium]